MKITVAQLNPTIGDLGSNVDRLATVVAEADGSDLVVGVLYTTIFVCR